MAPVRQLSTIFTATPPVPNNIAGGSWSLTQVRNKGVRNNWPRPREGKRVKTHGYKTRMSTLHGRKIIMRRILAGRFILSH